MLFAGCRSFHEDLPGITEVQALDVRQFHHGLVAEVGFVKDGHLHPDSKTEIYGVLCRGGEPDRQAEFVGGDFHLGGELLDGDRGWGCLFLVRRHMSFSEYSSEISGFPISYFAGALVVGEPGAPQKQIPAVLRLLPGGREQHRMLAVPLRGRSRRLVVGAGLQFVPSSQLFPPFS